MAAQGSAVGRGPRKASGVMEMSSPMIVVALTELYIFVQTHQNTRGLSGKNPATANRRRTDTFRTARVHSKWDHFVIWELNLNKVSLKKKRLLKSTLSK